MVGLLEYCQHVHPVLPHRQMLQLWSGDEFNNPEITVVNVHFSHRLVLADPHEGGLAVAQPIVVPHLPGCLLVGYHLLLDEEVGQLILKIEVYEVQGKDDIFHGIDKAPYLRIVASEAVARGHPHQHVRL